MARRLSWRVLLTGTALSGWIFFMGLPCNRVRSVALRKPLPMRIGLAGGVSGKPVHSGRGCPRLAPAQAFFAYTLNLLRISRIGCGKLCETVVGAGPAGSPFLRHLRSFTAC